MNTIKCTDNYYRDTLIRKMRNIITNSETDFKDICIAFIFNLNFGFCQKQSPVWWFLIILVRQNNKKDMLLNRKNV